MTFNLSNHFRLFFKQKILKFLCIFVTETSNPGTFCAWNVFSSGVFLLWNFWLLCIFVTEASGPGTFWAWNFFSPGTFEFCTFLSLRHLVLELFEPGTFLALEFFALELLSSGNFEFLIFRIFFRFRIYIFFRFCAMLSEKHIILELF